MVPVNGPPVIANVYSTYQGVLVTLDYDPTVHTQQALETSENDKPEVVETTTKPTTKKGRKKATTNPLNTSNPSNTSAALQGGRRGGAAPPPHNTVIVLDISGSMGDEAARLARTILPDMLRRLGYTEMDAVTLITFEGKSQVYKTTVGHMAKLGIRDRGCTMMAPAIEHVSQILTEWYGSRISKTPLRILTVSDGAIDDTKSTFTAANALATWFKNLNIHVNSQAIRFFSSDYANPDTRALCSLLQLNAATTASTAVDVNNRLSDADIAEIFTKTLLDNDTLVLGTLVCDPPMPLFKALPWEKEAQDTLCLGPGRNHFWMPNVPPEEMIITIQEGTVDSITTISKTQEGSVTATGKIKMVRRVTFVTRDDTDTPLAWRAYETLLEDKLLTILNQLRVLKIVDTDDAKQRIQTIRDYFVGLERDWSLREAAANATKTESNINENSLSSRVKRMRTLVEKRSKSILQQLFEIANDTKVAQLNSAQQASYLRAVDVSKNAKSLAKRATAHNASLDFDEIARTEVKAMHAHLSELDNVDDTMHEKSFFSFDTTLGGIRAVCDLAADGSINEMSCMEILELLNIVGIACTHPIGEYPDPMSFRVNTILLGSFVSLGDALTHIVQSKGKPLRMPGTDTEIVNVVPFFEDARIIAFYRRYAPTLLEFTASVGMRRVVANIKMTFGYTVLAGFWHLVEMMAQEKTELTMQLIVRLGQSLPWVVGNYFAHIIPILTAPQPDTRVVYHIGGNGITNLIVPLLTILSSDNAKIFLDEFMPCLLRSLYAFEVWVAIRKMYRHIPNSDEVVQDMFKKLCGVTDTYVTHWMPVQPLFEPEPESPAFDDLCQYTIDKKYLKELQKRFWYVKTLQHMAPVLAAIADNKTVAEKMKTLENALTPISSAALMQSMKITYSADTFDAFVIVQALLYPTKTDRMTDDESKMLLPDLADESVGTNMIRTRVRQIVAEQYAVDLAAKKVLEKEHLTRDLVDELVTTPSIRDFVFLLRDGMTRGTCHVQIANAGSDGFTPLQEQLLRSGSVPHQVVKCWVLLLGRRSKGKRLVDDTNDETPESKYGPVVWNNGNVLGFANLDAYRAVFEYYNQLALWSRAESEYQERRRHMYRDPKNRHGHSNDKPSYWAMGYKTMHDMKSKVSADTFMQYLSNHTNCCRDPYAPPL